MIPDLHTAEIIGKRFPEIDFSTAKAEGIFNAFEVIADYAILLVDNNRHTDLASICGLLDELLQHGGTATATSIENIFVFRLSSHIGLCAHRKELLQLMPGRLHEIMIAQFNSSAL